MKETDKAYIAIAKFGSPFGVRGWLKVQSYTESRASVLDYQPWYIETPSKQWEVLHIEDSRLQQNTVLVKLAGIENPEEARLLTNKLIMIPRAQLPKLESDEYYWSDLKALTVITQTGVVLGQVINIIETGSNDVLIVKGDKEHAIPYLPGSVILKVDLKKQEIHVNWDPLY